MLTVWCLRWGDKYDDYAVQRLQSSVRRYLAGPHRFICITDKRISGVATMPPSVDWPGWWQKIQLWKPGICDAQNIWLDLDVVITGSLDFLLDYTSCELAMPLNWAASGHGGCQSSVMVWGQTRNTIQIYRDFDPAWAHWPPVNQPGVLWGDQEWITKLRDTGKINVTPIDERYVKSYKYHCKNGLPEDCRIVVFHGDPKPSEVKEPWFHW
jgi:hypothetical protein